MENLPCPICQTPATATRPGDSLLVACPRCTTFKISGSAIALLENGPLSLEQRANASGWIRETRSDLIRAEDVERLHHVQPPLVAEQATRLLRAIAAEHRVPGETFWVPFKDPALQGVAWAVNDLHVIYLIKEYLGDERRFLKVNPIADQNRYQVQITPAGWAFLGELGATSGSSQAFVAMCFDASTLSLRQEAIVPAIVAAGYRPLLIDEKEHNNDIVEEILGEIRQSRFLVADFTHQRGGVYHEAGFAQGLGLPVIRTCLGEQVKELHFDVNHYPFLLWKQHDLADFRDRLERRIKAVLGWGPLRPT